MKPHPSITRALGGALAALTLGVAGSILAIAPAHAVLAPSAATAVTELPDTPGVPAPQPVDGTGEAPYVGEPVAGASSIIRGEVRVGTSGSNASSPDVVVYLYRDAGDIFEYVGYTTTASGTGAYEFVGLLAGTYALEFLDASGQYSKEYWQDSRYWNGHDDVELADDETEVLPLTLLAPRTYDVFRVAGDNRFSTGVAISQERFADGETVPVIYITSGRNYPDALSAGPAAIAQGGGMLLVEPQGIPPEVAAELERIDPQRIVVVGGTAAVSSAVETALRAYVPTAGDVDRIGGADRYTTSRLLVEDAFGSAEDVFIATGTNFPDALAATPAAGYRGGPLLLVPGTAASIDTATYNLLSSLGAIRMHVAGGPNAVSPGLVNSLYSVPSVEFVYRYAGANRFETAVILNFYTFPTADYAFIANGYGFADALAGGPLAGYLGSPVYLSEPTCIPAYVLEDIEIVGANGVVLLGGTSVLSQNVANLGSCGGPASGVVTDVRGLQSEVVVGRQ